MLTKTLVVISVLKFVVNQETDHTPVIGRQSTKCYDDFNRPQRCIPEFENAAFGVLMEATNTCGNDGDIEYCVQTGITGRKSCEICRANDHHSRYLTDLHNTDSPTWWQSETMFEGIQFPNQVNLTLKFGKAFDITYVRLWFYSPRPESFQISKKTREDGPWLPYQYYSATCRDTYGLPDSTHTTKGEETRALCTSEYADISPLRGGNVAFGTLEGRPSAYNFDASPELQEWVTATEIMITLDRLNTFGDEVFGDKQVLRSYFYALADVAVGARCKCNGHASECIASTGVDGTRRRVCKCEHNTAGPDCNICLPFYNDAPWARATAKNAHECKQCNCNGYSTKCYFDQKLYEQSGHGGHCIDCISNRDGPNCERCRENYYMREDGYCIACNCNEIGSNTLQCNSEGRCRCKPGVTGDKCDRCDANHYDFTAQGCKPCNCSPDGSANNEPTCDPNTGICYCKENVEGKRCRDCKPGFFNLDIENEYGCTPCFCYGHSSQCNSAMGYAKYQIESTFAKSSERWRAIDEYGRNLVLKYDAYTQSVGVQALNDEVIYFVAPDRFLGDQRASYNQLLQFSLRIGDNRAIPTALDVILEGNTGRITNTIFAQNNPPPTIQSHMYKFRLHESGWQPRLSARDFISILTNLTAIMVKGTYGPQSVGFLDDVKLETASKVAGREALWVEQCECPPGYVGQYCESCAPGFRHVPTKEGIRNGPFMSCIPCDCHKHADICDSETGRCICRDNTAGDNCERCARGYYGNAEAGTPDDCHPCGCPNGGSCVQMDDETTICTECPTGYMGGRCEVCADGYFGDPTGRFGVATPCQPCDCNLNIDPNAIENCNTSSGECLRCIYNTGGPKCEKCLPGFYGNALVLPKGDCKPCECYGPGTEQNREGAIICDQSTGTCHCKQNVVGRNCDKCADGFYNLQSGEGCQPCNCNTVGSFNQTCDVYTGQCYCRPGVVGLTCDQCEVRKYGFSMDGCKDCDCDSIGSRDLQCDATGQCPCLDNVEGRRCDRCKENKYDRRRGCIDCPDCYNLVQKEAKEHSSKLSRLNEFLDEIERRPTVIADDEFPDELEHLQNDIDDFYDKVKNATGEDSVIQQVYNIRKREKDIRRVLSEMDENMFVINNTAQLTAQKLEDTDIKLEQIKAELDQTFGLIEQNGKEVLEQAWARAETVGQQSEKMTEIAQEARELADRLTERAENLKKQGEEAKNKSNIAFNQVKNATIMQNEISEETRRMRGELVNAEVRLNNTLNTTKQAREDAKEAKDEALSLLNEVNNLVVPYVDTDDLRKESKSIREEAKKLLEKSEMIFRNNEEQLNNVEERLDFGRDLLMRAQEQQDETADLLNELHIYKSQADKAVNLGDTLLNETKSIYNLLTDFDTETQKNKEEAEKALGTINEIQQIIYDTQRKTDNAQNILQDAKLNADHALHKAKQADELAKNASSNAKVFKMEAQDLNKNATALSNEAELMFDRVKETESQLKLLLDGTRSNDSLVEQAKEKVGRAGKETDDTSRKVQEVVKDVEDIMNELQNSPNIDKDALQRLEQQIEEVEAKLEDSELEQKLEALQKHHKSQNDLIEQYRKDILYLQDEVQNIENIVKALPDGCFKRVELEP